jgi:hypothetical protein
VNGREARLAVSERDSELGGGTNCEWTKKDSRNQKSLFKSNNLFFPQKCDESKKPRGLASFELDKISKNKTSF